MKRNNSSKRQKSSAKTSMPHSLRPPANNENKKAWVALGSKYEKEFVKLLGKCSIKAEINPQKKVDPYATDLLVEGRVAELKTRRTPFFKTAQYGISPDTATTINKKDIERYSKTNPGMVIFFWVYWPAQESYGVKVEECCGVWFARMDKLKKICESAPVKTYENRSGEDGNKTESYIIDLNDLRQIM